MAKKPKTPNPGGIRFTTSSPRLLVLLEEALYQVDPMGTGSVENELFDEYDDFAKALVREAFHAEHPGELTVFGIRAAMQSAGIDVLSDDPKYGVVARLLDDDTDTLLQQFQIGHVVLDFTAPRELQTLPEMSKADMQWGELVTAAEVVEMIACYGLNSDESGHWVTEHDGKYYAGEMIVMHPSVTTVETIPAGATHAFWWGK